MLFQLTVKHSGQVEPNGWKGMPVYQLPQCLSPPPMPAFGHICNMLQDEGNRTVLVCQGACCPPCYKTTISLHQIMGGLAQYMLCACQFLYTSSMQWGSKLTTECGRHQIDLGIAQVQAWKFADLSKLGL